MYLTYMASELRRQADYLRVPISSQAKSSLADISFLEPVYGICILFFMGAISFLIDLVINVISPRIVVGGVDCLDEGLVFFTTHAVPMPLIPWYSVKALTHLPWFRGGAIMCTSDRTKIDLHLLPNEILDRLACIVREHSNAQVTGFNEIE